MFYQCGKQKRIGQKLNANVNKKEAIPFDLNDILVWFAGNVFFLPTFSLGF